MQHIHKYMLSYLLLHAITCHLEAIYTHPIYDVIGWSNTESNRIYTNLLKCNLIKMTWPVITIQASVLFKMFHFNLNTFLPLNENK